MKIGENLLEYVKARTENDPLTGCWNWNGAGGQRPVFRLHGKTILVYRALWEYLHNVKLLSAEMVCHHCDNGRCCNPDHLFQGTARDNNLDAVIKGRNFARKDPIRNRAALAKGQNVRQMNPDVNPRGNRHWTRRHPEWLRTGENHWTKTTPHLVRRGTQVHNARFSSAEISAIRGDTRLLREIAEDYECHLSTISYIRRGKHYSR